MKKFHRKTGLIFASWAMLLIFGCHKKKPPVPTQEPAPTVMAGPPETPPAPATQEPQNPPSAQEQPQTTTNNPPEKPTPKHPKRPATPPVKKPAPEPEKPSEVAKNTPPPRVVIQQGGTSASGSGRVSGTNDNSTNQATTQQLIDSAEANLRSIKRQLSSEEQTHVTEIRDYIKQSKDATKDGDLVGAHNLAQKARLLSDELVKTK